jgi:guanine deaminase
MFDRKFMKRTLELSKQALSVPGTEPFGAVVVLNGQIVGEGLNHSLANYDPTSHGEIEAIRDACRNMKRVELHGCDLYTSCEPCSLCVAAMYIVGIRNLFYAASLKQAESVLNDLAPELRHNFDLDALRHETGALVNDRSMPSEQRMDQEAIALIKEWLSFRSMQKSMT